MNDILSYSSKIHYCRVSGSPKLFNLTVVKAFLSMKWSICACLHSWIRLKYFLRGKCPIISTKLLLYDKNYVPYAFLNRNLHWNKKYHKTMLLCRKICHTSFISHLVCCNHFDLKNQMAFGSHRSPVHHFLRSTFALTYQSYFPYP